MLTSHDPAHAADEILLGFAAAVRVAGVPVTADRTHAFLEAVALVGFDDQRATWLAGRATLCGGPDDLERYDQVFEAWFLAREGLPTTRPRPESAAVAARLPAEADSGGESPDDEVLRVAASETEVLRTPRHRRPVGHRPGPAEPDVRSPRAPATAAPGAPAYSVASR